MSLITLPHAVFIYDENGNPVPVVSGSTLTSGSRGFVVYGKDGSNQARNFTVDSSGNLLITGSVTVNNFPATQTITGTVNVNNQPTTITVTQLTASELNATITGTVAVQNIDVALSTRLADNTFTARVNTLGQNVMTGSTPVVIASNQSEYPVVQGTATSASNAWPVKVTDGTNYLPTLDVQDRAGFVKLTDGTNNAVTVKTGSVSASIADNALVTALSPNTQLPSGSNTIGYVMQGLSASLSGAWPVRVTDGTNIMPTADVDARASFIRLSNGTASVDVITGSQTVTTASNSLVVQISPNQEPIPTTVVPATSIAGSSIGRVAGVSANTFTAVRQTTYVEQTINAQRSIVSTSANDSAAGTGARQVRITYLDATAAGPFTEILTLNGLTAVNTVNTNICFIERIDVISVGSNGSNVGTLNLYTATGATGVIFAAIGVGALATGVGDNQTLYAHHYVPTGYRVTGYYVSCGVSAAAGGGSSTSIIRYRNPTVATSPFMLASDIINSAQGNSASRVYYVSINIPGPLVLLAYSTPGTNNSILTVSFDYADAPI